MNVAARPITNDRKLWDVLSKEEKTIDGAQKLWPGVFGLSLNWSPCEISTVAFGLFVKLIDLVSGYHGRLRRETR